MQQLKHAENTHHLFYFEDLLLPFYFLAIWGGGSIYDPLLHKLTLLKL